ncbi:hypothetical protein BJ742DRAFT_559153 [Cladochytrium replicatum]|nr:hypothetical protein BJ742DRAFT_559153 [Cladochytrium replicatum]
MVSVTPDPSARDVFKRSVTHRILRSTDVHTSSPATTPQPLADGSPFQKYPDRASVVAFSKAHLDYSASLMNSNQSYRKLLAGSLGGKPGDAGAPSAVRKKVVKVYVSYAYGDADWEVRALKADVFPFMDHLCRLTGHELQVIDLRADTRDELAKGDPFHGGLQEQMIREEAIRELRDAIESSQGPAFICLLGNKYGTRILPSSIQSGDFAILTSSTGLAASDLDLLNAWYVPPTTAGLPYTVRAIPERYANSTTHLGSLPPTERHAIATAWTEEVARLRNVFAKAAAGGGGLSEEFKALCKLGGRSLLGEEVEVALDGLGAKKEGAKSQNRFFAVRRSFDAGLLSELSSSDPKVKALAATAVDHLSPLAELSTSDPIQLDDDAARSLEELYARIPSANLVGNYNVAWRSQFGGLDPTRDSFAREYIRQLCDDVAHSLCAHLVEFWKARDAGMTLGEDDEVGSGVGPGSVLDMDPIVRELMEMRRRVWEDVVGFVGREATLSKLRREVFSMSFGDGGGRGRLWVVVGDPGSGKTATLAKAVEVAMEVHPNAAVIHRIVGATSGSSTLRGLLHGIATQIARVLPAGTAKRGGGHVPTEVHRLTRWIEEQCAEVRHRPMVLIVDGVDALEEVRNAGSAAAVGAVVGWVPLVVAQNTTVVVSARPGAVCDALVKRVGGDRVINLAGLTKEEVEKMAGKSGEAVVKGIRDVHGDREVLPMMVFSALRMAEIGELGWFPRTVEGCLDRLLEMIEGSCGSQFVERALGYLAAAYLVGGGGLSRRELEDVMSCDDEFLDRALPKSSVAVGFRRVPQYAIRQILTLLKGFVRTTLFDDEAVVTFTNRQFCDAVCNRYMLAPGQLQYLAGQLADLFSDRWAYDEKAFRSGSKQQRAYRLTFPQPLLVDTKPEVTPNRRRWALSVPLLLKAGKTDDVVEWLEDFKNVCVAIKAGWAYDLVALIETAMSWEAAEGEVGGSSSLADLPEREVLASLRDFVLVHGFRLAGHPPEAVLHTAINQPQDSPIASLARSQWLEQYREMLRGDVGVVSPVGPGGLVVPASSNGVNAWVDWLNRPLSFNARCMASLMNRFATAPIVVSTDCDPKGDTVYTLHSDGMVRSWKLATRDEIRNVGIHMSATQAAGNLSTYETHLLKAFPGRLRVSREGDGRIAVGWLQEVHVFSSSLERLACVNIPSRTASLAYIMGLEWVAGGNGEVLAVAVSHFLETDDVDIEELREATRGRIAAGVVIEGVDFEDPSESEVVSRIETCEVLVYNGGDWSTTPKARIVNVGPNFLLTSTSTTFFAFHEMYRDSHRIRMVNLQKREDSPVQSAPDELGVESPQGEDVETEKWNAVGTVGSTALLTDSDLGPIARATAGLSNGVGAGSPGAGWLNWISPTVGPAQAHVWALSHDARFALIYLREQGCALIERETRHVVGVLEWAALRRAGVCDYFKEVEGIFSSGSHWGMERMLQTPGPGAGLLQPAPGTPNPSIVGGPASLHTRCRTHLPTISPDGTEVAFITRGGSVGIWGVDSGQNDKSSASVGGPRRLLRKRTLVGHREDVIEAVWSPDGRTLMTAAADGSARVWEMTPHDFSWNSQGRSRPRRVRNTSGAVVVVDRTGFFGEDQEPTYQGRHYLAMSGSHVTSDIGFDELRLGNFVDEFDGEVDSVLMEFCKAAIQTNAPISSEEAATAMVLNSGPNALSLAVACKNVLNTVDLSSWNTRRVEKINPIVHITPPTESSSERLGFTRKSTDTQRLFTTTLSVSTIDSTGRGPLSLGPLLATYGRIATVSCVALYDPSKATGLPSSATSAARRTKSSSSVKNAGSPSPTTPKSAVPDEGIKLAIGYDSGLVLICHQASQARMKTGTRLAGLLADNTAFVFDSQENTIITESFGDTPQDKSTFNFPLPGQESANIGKASTRRVVAFPELDDGLVAIGTSRLFSIWDLERETFARLRSPDYLSKYNPGSGAPGSPGGSTKSVLSVSELDVVPVTARWMSDDSLIAAICTDNALRVWDVAQAHLIKEYRMWNFTREIISGCFAGALVNTSDKSTSSSGSNGGASGRDLVAVTDASGRISILEMHGLSSLRAGVAAPVAWTSMMANGVRNAAGLTSRWQPTEEAQTKLVLPKETLAIIGRELDLDNVPAVDVARKWGWMQVAKLVSAPVPIDAPLQLQPVPNGSTDGSDDRAGTPTSVSSQSSATEVATTASASSANGSNNVDAATMHTFVFYDEADQRQHKHAFSLESSDSVTGGWRGVSKYPITHWMKLRRSKTLMWEKSDYIHYFEMMIRSDSLKNSGRRRLAIGVATGPQIVTNVEPGTTPIKPYFAVLDCFDGKVYVDDGSIKNMYERSIAADWTASDDLVFGCGVKPSANTVFFTRNGVLISETRVNSSMQNELANFHFVVTASNKPDIKLYINACQQPLMAFC